MEFWKYVLVDKRTESFACAEGFFKTMAEAETAGKTAAEELWDDEAGYDLQVSPYTADDVFTNTEETDPIEERFHKYYDEVGKAIRILHKAATGYDIQEDMAEKAVEEIHKELASEFCGCFPGFRKEDNLLCYLKPCVTKCPDCPILCADGIFPEFTESSDKSARAIASDLIRLVKCSKEYIPSEGEIDKAISVVTNWQELIQEAEKDENDENDESYSPVTLILRILTVFIAGISIGISIANIMFNMMR